MKSQMMKILYFGRLRESAGRSTEMLNLPDSITHLSMLKTWLDSAHELGGALDDASVKTMVNQTIVHSDLPLSGDEEIGFLPPVGGG